MTDSRTVTLGDVVQVVSGFAFPSEQFGEAGDLPVVRIRDVVPGCSQTYYTGDYQPKYLVANGDLLVGMDGEFNCGMWAGGPALLNQRVCRVVARPEAMDQGYLRLLLPKVLKSIEARTPQSTVKHLSVRQVEAISVPLPPLPEQRRIATLLDKADAIRRNRKQAIRIADDLVQSSYLALVGPGHRDYDQWPMFRIGQLADPRPGSMRTGPFGSALRHSEFVAEGIAVLGIDNAVQNRFAWAERRFITPEKYTAMARYTVKPGDVIITIMGTTGRSAVVPDDVPVAISTKHLATITVNRALVHPEFLSNAIHRSPHVVSQLGSKNRGAIMAGLNLGLIRSLEVRLPPIEAQERFAGAISAIRGVEERCRAAEEQADHLFHSLVQRAFGEKP